MLYVSPTESIIERRSSELGTWRQVRWKSGVAVGSLGRYEDARFCTMFAMWMDGPKKPFLNRFIVLTGLQISRLMQNTMRSIQTSLFIATPYTSEFFDAIFPQLQYDC